MPSVFLKISTTDLTSAVDVQTYKCRREDVYTQWTDGDWIDHRSVARTRISGSCKVGFSSATAYANFLTLLSSSQASDGSYPLSVYVLNTGTLENINAFLDIQDESKWALAASRQWVVFSLKFEEV